MPRIKVTNRLRKDSRNYVLGFLCIICVLLYWLFLYYGGNCNIISLIIGYFDIFDNIKFSFGFFYPICFSLLYLITNYFIDNELQALGKYLP